MEVQNSLFPDLETPAKPKKARKAKAQKELSGAQDLYNYLYEACNKLRGPVSQDNFKEYITPLLYYKRISDVYDEETEAALDLPRFPSNTVLLYPKVAVGTTSGSVLRILAQQ